MNVLSSAFGLLQLKHVDATIEKRKVIDKTYREGLGATPGIRCHIQPEDGKANYSYFPILVDEKFSLTRDQLYEELRKNGINGRRYFYPLITEFDVYKDSPFVRRTRLPVAKRAADQVICLPIHPYLTNNDLQKIITIVNKNS